MKNAVRVVTVLEETHEIDGATRFEIMQTGHLVVYSGDRLSAAYAPGQWASVVDYSETKDEQ